MIVLTVALCPCVNAKEKQKKDTRPLWKRIFVPPKKEPPKKRHVTRHKESSTPIPTVGGRTPSGMFIVDYQWYADYVEMEAAWSYYIPDDDYIEFKDKHVYVPPVSYRHFQDMVEAHKQKRYIGDALRDLNYPR